MSNLRNINYMSIFNLITPVSCEENHIYMGNGGSNIALQISLFTNIDLGNVRTTVINGIPYLCYNDICNSLGTRNQVDKIIPKLDREFQIVKAYGYQDELPYIYINLIQKVGYGERSYPYLFVSESSFYNILESSRTEKAVLFRRWIQNKEVCDKIFLIFRKVNNEKDKDKTRLQFKIQYYYCNYLYNWNCFAC